MPRQILSRLHQGAFGLVLGGVAAALVGASAQAEEWPERPVTMVVPFGPGASNDIFTRKLADVLTEQLGQPFVVENRPGAGGYTGTLAVSQASADGYRFVQMPNSVVGFAPIMGVDIDPLTDLTPVAIFARAPGSMVVPASLPVNTVQEFVEYAAENAEDVFVGYTGIGATQHQMAELFRKTTGLELNTVNYQSSAEAQTDLIAGRLQLMFVTVASVLGQIESGDLRLLAYTNDSFPATAPSAPVLADAGIEGMEGASVWWAIFGPAGLPDDITTKMNAAINAALDDPEFVELMGRSGAVPVKLSPEEFVQIIRDEEARVQEFLDFTGIEPE